MNTTANCTIIQSLLIALVLLTAPLSTHAASYYVDDAGGSDSNVGVSPGAAWRSLTRVNSATFGPGDRILFKAGGVWSGDLIPQGSGAAGAPVTVDEYGAGPLPRINGVGNNAGAATVLLQRQQYWTVQDLSVTNSRSDGAANGIVVATAGAGLLRGLHVRNCEVTGLGDGTAGITFYTGDPSHPGDQFDDVLIENNSVHNTRTGGIYLSLYPIGARSTNVVVRGNVVDSIGYDGLFLQYCQNPLVEHNTVYRAGTTVAHPGDSIPMVSVLFINCAGATVQYNEVAYTATSLDSQAFDCDNYNTGVFYFQYNYSHDNTGGFFMMCAQACLGAGDWCSVRYNISQNDNTSNPILRIQSAHVAFYNNVFYDAHQLLLGENYSVAFVNNIFMTPVAHYYMVPGSFQGNLYSGNTPPAGIDTAPVIADPLFVAPGRAGDGYATVDGYKLRAGSPCFGAGQFVAGNGGQDFWGDPVPSSGAPDIGAFQHIGGVPAPPPAPAPAPPPAPAGPVIANGSFESPPVGTGGYSDFAYAPPGAAWAFSPQAGDGGAGVAGNGSGFTAGNPAAPDGVQVGFVQSTGAVSQAVAFPAGTYRVSFQAAQRANWGGSQTVRVLVDGQAVGSFTPAGAAFQAFTTAAFTVTAGAHTVAFQGAIAGDNTAFLDAVTLSGAPVTAPAPAPAPASVTVLNASFESPSVGTGGYSDFAYAPPGAAWAFSPQAGDGGAGVAGNGSGFTAGNPAAPDGVQVGFVQSTGAVSQAVAFPAGTYRVSFQAAQRANWGGSQTVRVLVDGQAVGSFTPAGAAFQAFTTAAFTVTAGAHTVAFQGAIAGDNTAFLDAVQVHS